MFVSPVNQNSSLNFTAVRGYRTMLNAENNAIGSDEALLMLQDPKSAVIFKQNQKEAKKANDSNPVTALGYKLYRTFKYIANNSYNSAVENKAEKENTDNIALLELLKEDMTKYYPSLMSEAKDKGDRGLLRALTWGEKVTNMAKNLLERYLKEGPSFLEGKKIYVCSICGFIYVGNNLPNICPVCKVPSFKFVEIKEDLK